MLAAERIVVADVGASWTRLRVGLGESAWSPIRSTRALVDRVREACAILPRGTSCFVGGFAGAVARDRGSVRMTNWDDASPIRAADLREFGFDRIVLLNDIEAAAHGLIDLLAEDPPNGVHSVFAEPVPGEGNRLLVLPGTGLGSAGIVETNDGGAARWHVVPSEAQHALAPSIGGPSGELFDRMADRLGYRPRWEDCVSGRGLEALFGLAGGDRTTASQIAKAALAGEATAVRALRAYYATAGRFCQGLALAFLSYGGVFLAGASTRANLSFIGGTRFGQEFRESPASAPTVLQEIPVFLVTEELNLRGAWSVATSGSRNTGRPGS